MHLYYSREHISLDTYYQQAFKKTEGQILRGDATKIMSSEIETLAKEFSKNLLLRKVEIYPDKLEKIAERRVQTIPAHKRDRFYRDEGDLDFEFEYIKVRIPVSSSLNLNEYRKFTPSSFSLSWTPDKLEIRDNFVEFEIVIKGYGIGPDENRIKQAFEFEKKQILEWVNCLNRDIENLNKQHMDKLVKFIESRQQALKSGNVQMQSLIDSL